MTASDLANRALGHVERPSNVAEFDPITLTILLAILGAVITHYVEKCLDKLDHRTLTNPGPVTRWKVWLDCLWAAQKQGGTREHATLAYDALLKTGAGMTPDDLAQLKAA